MWAALIVNIVIAVIAYALTPRPKPPTPTAGTLDIPAPKLGEPICVVFGEVWIDDPALSYYGNSNTTPIKSKGGK